MEVVIALFLLGLMLLGLDAMQVSAFKKAKANYYLSYAEQQLSAITARLRVLQTADPTAFIQRWNQQNANGLPNGQGEVVGAYPDFTITIHWGTVEDISCTKGQSEIGGCLRIHTVLS